MLRWEQARCLYALRAPEGMSIAKALAAECRKDVGREKNPWAAQVLSTTGLWLSESRLERHEVIQKDKLPHCDCFHFFFNVFHKAASPCFTIFASTCLKLSPLGGLF